MGSQQIVQPTPSLITIPSNYPNIPTPGKLRILWDANHRKLYRKLSPYAEYHQSLIGGFTSQPFFYTFIDEAGKGVSGLKKYESRAFPVGSAPIDIIRTSKFLASGNGIIFLGKQFLLQTGNPYNETRIYNPISPIVAAGMSISLGTIRPQRNFDTSGGLGGIARTLIGNKIPDALFGAPKINPPSGTVSSALPDATLTTGGKGLLRAGTANRGFSHLQAAWPETSKGSSLSGGFKSVLKGLATSMFANFIPQNQNGMKVRSDEGAYGIMVGAGGTKFVYVDKNGSVVGFGQQWIAGGKDIRKKGQYPSAYRLFVGSNGIPARLTNDNLANKKLVGIGAVGYTVEESTNQNSPGVRYGDNVGTSKSEEFENSEVMLQYASYTSEKNTYSTKHTTAKKATEINDTLKKTLEKIKKSGIYSVEVPNESTVVRSGNFEKNGYDRLYSTTLNMDRKRGVSPVNYPLGVLQDYRNVRTVDDTVGSQRPSMRLPTGNFDAINTLTVLPKKSIADLNSSTTNLEWERMNLKGWETRQWSPYNDDQIALYFYDVVNEKYIPFRAAIKGLSETSTATWEEMTFIGRGDKVYSYGGFNRNLAFSLDIVVNSIVELAPTWQRINYLTTLIKPANYTTSTVNQVTNRFMIAPMVMLTIGDMYKDQPVLIQSIAVTVGDDAVWETNNEFNSSEWSYLASYIKSPNVLYGQLPRQVNISLGFALLEKERAIVGGANFGSAPRTEDWSAWNSDIVPNAGSPNKLHKSLVVDVTSKTENPVLLDAGSPFQSTLNQSSNIV